MVMLRRVLRDMREAPAGSLVTLDATIRSASEAGVLPAAVGAQARRWERAVQRAESYAPWRVTCLARSITLHRLLERHAVPGSRVCVGVNGGAAGFEAHAWVEIADVVFGDRPDVAQQWTRLADARAASPSLSVR